MAEREIRADYDDRSIIVYQAYRKEIALAQSRTNQQGESVAAQRARLSGQRGHCAAAGDGIGFWLHL
jgi:hypothetical protein